MKILKGEMDLGGQYTAFAIEKKLFFVGHSYCSINQMYDGDFEDM